MLDKRGEDGPKFHKFLHQIEASLRQYNGNGIPKLNSKGLSIRDNTIYLFLSLGVNPGSADCNWGGVQSVFNHLYFKRRDRFIVGVKELFNKLAPEPMEVDESDEDHITNSQALNAAKEQLNNIVEDTKEWIPIKIVFTKFRNNGFLTPENNKSKDVTQGNHLQLDTLNKQVQTKPIVYKTKQMHAGAKRRGSSISNEDMPRNVLKKRRIILKTTRLLDQRHAEGEITIPGSHASSERVSPPPRIPPRKRIIFRTARRHVIQDASREVIKASGHHSVKKIKVLDKVMSLKWRLGCIHTDIMQTYLLFQPLSRLNIIIQVFGIIEHLCYERYERYYLSTLSLLLQIYSRKAIDLVGVLNIIQSKLPRIMNDILGPVINYISEEGQIGVSQGVQISFPSEGEENQRQCIRLWHFLLQYGQPIVINNPDILSITHDIETKDLERYFDENFNSDSSLLVKSFRDRVTRESWALNEEKKWFYNLARQLLQQHSYDTRAMDDKLQANEASIQTLSQKVDERDSAIQARKVDLEALQKKLDERDAILLELEKVLDGTDNVQLGSTQAEQRLLDEQELFDDVNDDAVGSGILQDRMDEFESQTRGSQMKMLMPATITGNVEGYSTHILEKLNRLIENFDIQRARTEAAEKGAVINDGKYDAAMGKLIKSEHEILYIIQIANKEGSIGNPRHHVGTASQGAAEKQEATGSYLSNLGILKGIMEEMLNERAEHKQEMAQIQEASAHKDSEIYRLQLDYKKAESQWQKDIMEHKHLESEARELIDRTKGVLNNWSITIEKDEENTYKEGLFAGPTMDEESGVGELDVTERVKDSIIQRIKNRTENISIFKASESQMDQQEILQPLYRNILRCLEELNNADQGLLYGIELKESCQGFLDNNKVDIETETMEIDIEDQISIPDIKEAGNGYITIDQKDQDMNEEASERQQPRHSTKGFNKRIKPKREKEEIRALREERRANIQKINFLQAELETNTKHIREIELEDNKTFQMLKDKLQEIKIEVGVANRRVSTEGEKSNTSDKAKEAIIKEYLQIVSELQDELRQKNKLNEELDQKDEEAYGTLFKAVDIFKSLNQSISASVPQGLDSIVTNPQEALEYIQSEAEKFQQQFKALQSLCNLKQEEIESMRQSQEISTSQWKLQRSGIEAKCIELSAKCAEWEAECTQLKDQVSHSQEHWSEIASLANKWEIILNKDKENASKLYERLMGTHEQYMGREISLLQAIKQAREAVLKRITERHDRETLQSIYNGINKYLGQIQSSKPGLFVGPVIMRELQATPSRHMHTEFLPFNSTLIPGYNNAKQARQLILQQWIEWALGTNSKPVIQLGDLNKNMQTAGWKCNLIKSRLVNVNPNVDVHLECTCDRDHSECIDVYIYEDFFDSMEKLIEQIKQLMAENKHNTALKGEYDSLYKVIIDLGRLSDAIDGGSLPEYYNEANNRSKKLWVDILKQFDSKENQHFESMQSLSRFSKAFFMAYVNMDKSIVHYERRLQTYKDSQEAMQKGLETKDEQLAMLRSRVTVIESKQANPRMEMAFNKWNNLFAKLNVLENMILPMNGGATPFKGTDIWTEEDYIQVSLEHAIKYLDQLIKDAEKWPRQKDYYLSARVKSVGVNKGQDHLTPNSISKSLHPPTEFVQREDVVLSKPPTKDIFSSIQSALTTTPDFVNVRGIEQLICKLHRHISFYRIAIIILQRHLKQQEWTREEQALRDSMVNMQNMKKNQSVKRSRLYTMISKSTQVQFKTDCGSEKTSNAAEDKKVNYNIPQLIELSAERTSEMHSQQINNTDLFSKLKEILHELQLVKDKKINKSIGPEQLKLLIKENQLPFFDNLRAEFSELRGRQLQLDVFGQKMEDVTMALEETRKQCSQIELLQKNEVQSLLQKADQSASLMTQMTRLEDAIRVWKGYSESIKQSLMRDAALLDSHQSTETNRLHTIDHIIDLNESRQEAIENTLKTLKDTEERHKGFPILTSLYRLIEEFLQHTKIARMYAHNRLKSQLQIQKRNIRFQQDEEATFQTLKQWIDWLVESEGSKPFKAADAWILLEQQHVKEKMRNVSSDMTPLTSDRSLIRLVNNTHIQLENTKNAQRYLELLKVIISIKATLVSTQDTVACLKDENGLPKAELQARHLEDSENLYRTKPKGDNQDKQGDNDKETPRKHYREVELAVEWALLINAAQDLNNWTHKALGDNTESLTLTLLTGKAPTEENFIELRKYLSRLSSVIESIITQRAAQRTNISRNKTSHEEHLAVKESGYSIRLDSAPLTQLPVESKQARATILAQSVLIAIQKELKEYIKQLNTDTDVETICYQAMTALLQYRLQVVKRSVGSQGQKQLLQSQGAKHSITKIDQEIQCNLRIENTIWHVISATKKGKIHRLKLSKGPTTKSREINIPQLLFLGTEKCAKYNANTLYEFYNLKQGIENNDIHESLLFKSLGDRNKGPNGGYSFLVTFRDNRKKSRRYPASVLRGWGLHVRSEIEAYI